VKDQLLSKLKNYNKVVIKEAVEKINCIGTFIYTWSTLGSTHAYINFAAARTEKLARNTAPYGYTIFKFVANYNIRIIWGGVEYGRIVSAPESGIPMWSVN